MKTRTLSITRLPALATAALWAFSRLSNAAPAIAGADLLANEKPDDAGDSVNPNPTVPAWSYGHRPDMAGTALNPFVAGDHSDSFIGANDPIEGFYIPGGPSVPAVMVNTDTAPYSMNFGAGPIGPSEIFTHGGPPGPTALAVVRYTAPEGGLYDLTASFRSIHSGDTEGHIVVNGVSMFDSVIPPFGSAAPSLPGVSLAAGEIIDFVIGTGTTFGGDSTAFDATVSKVPISPAVSNIVRNDNGTQANPNDDTVSFTLNVAGVAGEVSPAGWTITAPAALAGTTGSYGVAKNITGVPIAAFSGAGQTMVVVVTDSGIPSITAPVTVSAPPPPMRRVNIDFEGQRAGDAGTAGLFVGQGAAGGGTFFNGIAVDSTGGPDDDAAPGDGNTDLLTVTGTNLLDSNSAPTTVSFTISPVAGDTEGSNGFEPASLYDDYIFNNSAGNQVGAAGTPFTISGLGSVATADLYFYFSFDAGRAGGTSVTGAGAGTLGTFNGFPNVLFFDDVPVSGGSVSGIFGVGNTGVLGGLTIATAITETPFSAWQQSEFGANAGDPAIAGPNADPEKDANENLIEYGLLGMPNSGSPATLFTQGQDGGKMTLNFQRDTARNDITIRIQSSTTLLPPWTDEAVSVNGAAFVPVGAAAVQETGAGTVKSVTFTDSAAIAAGPRRYLQIKVEQ
jgi:hypothetical protein